MDDRDWPVFKFKVISGVTQSHILLLNLLILICEIFILNC